MRLVRYFPTSSWISIRIISNNCPGFSWIALNNSATSVTLTVSSIGCSSFFNVSANTLYRRCALLYTLKQFHTIQFTLSYFGSVSIFFVFPYGPGNFGVKSWAGVTGATYEDKSNHVDSKKKED